MKYKFIVTSLLLACSFNMTHAKNPLEPKNVKASYVISQYSKTKYPIVFAHGMTGFIRLGTESFGIDYWHQILPDLARNGSNAWATRVSPFNSSEIRGEQLLKQVEDILAITGAEKINLIGHSHGAQSIRYIGGVLPQHVASMTTVAGPNRGSPIADLILKAEGTGVDKILTTVVNTFSSIVVLAQGLPANSFPHDSLAGAKALSTAGTAAFNKTFPLGMPTTACGDGPAQQKGISMYSFTGNKPFTNVLDPVDYALQVTSTLVDKYAGANDGLVPVCSARFGKTIRDNYAWNHLDEVNQVLGLRGLFSSDPVQVYREHANRLKLQGL